MPVVVTESGFLLAMSRWIPVLARARARACARTHWYADLSRHREQLATFPNDPAGFRRSRWARDGLAMGFFATPSRNSLESLQNPTS